MENTVDPLTLGLPSRTILEKIGPDIVAIVLHRKSRIIMADGLKIVEKADKIRQVMEGVTVALKTSAPICSKTIVFLENEGIQVLREE